ncbi:MAG: autotransporter domain-containing protein [Alphaproteobacteria bacterium]
MKQSQTTMKELTRAYRAVLKHAFMMSMGLMLAMPVMAEVLHANVGETKENYLEEISYKTTTMNEPALMANGENAFLRAGNDSTKSIILTQEAKDDTVRAMKGGKVYIKAQDVNITSAKDGLWAQNSTQTEADKSKIAEIDIKADKLTIKANDLAIVAMSQGIINLHAKQADLLGNILSRGGAHININTDEDDAANITSINGNVDFNYDEKTSGTPVNGNVKIALNGKTSSWTGNTMLSYTVLGHDRDAPAPEKLGVGTATILLNNGAVWNAIKIEENKKNTTAEYSGVLTDVTEGTQFALVNNLSINKGTVNVLDTERGVTIDKGTFADATFTGGPLNVNTSLDITRGENTFVGDILGENAAVNIAKGATLNIGDATMNVKSIALNGTMIANLTERDNAIITAGTFEGEGTMSLIAKNAGEYQVFGNAAFKPENIALDSSVYGLTWSEDNKTVTTTLKSVEDIAADNNLSADASQTVANLVSSSSDQLNNFGLLVQEHLANGNSKAVEDAHKAVNPEQASVVQSLASDIQGTVSKLAANRMMPVMGRNGGDYDVTGGGMWIQGLFNKSKKDGEFNGYTRGIAGGIDGVINRVFTVGFGYAFNHSDMDLNTRNTEIDSHTLFVYGQYKPSEWYINATLNYTMSDYDESGSALGVALNSDYDIKSFGGQVMTGYDFANGLTPEVGLRYLHIDEDTYTNSLGIQNKIDSADYLTAIVGGKYAKAFTFDKGMKLIPEIRLAAKYDLLTDTADTAVAMPGIDTYSMRANRLNRFGGEADVGITMSYKDVDLHLTYGLEVRKDYTSQTGMLKLKYNF